MPRVLVARDGVVMNVVGKWVDRISRTCELSVSSTTKSTRGSCCCSGGGVVGESSPLEVDCDFDVEDGGGPTRFAHSCSGSDLYSL